MWGFYLDTNNMRKNLLLIFTSLMLFLPNAFSQEKKMPEKPKMKFLGAFDAGQTGVSIYKLFDASDNVVCYVLTPDAASRKQTPEGLIYDANSVGSISCLMVKVPVIPLAPESPQIKK
jgi:hypothetical protein